MNVSQTAYEDLPLIRHPSGLVAKISIRTLPRGQKAVSFMLAKEFEREGRTEQTAWMGRRHVEAARELLDEVEKKIEEIEDQLRAEERAEREKSRENRRKGA